MEGEEIRMNKFDEARKEYEEHPHPVGWETGLQEACRQGVTDRTHAA